MKYVPERNPAQTPMWRIARKRCCQRGRRAPDSVLERRWWRPSSLPRDESVSYLFYINAAAKQVNQVEFKVRFLNF